MRSLKTSVKHLAPLFAALLMVCQLSITALAAAPQIWVKAENPTSEDAVTDIADFDLDMNVSYNSDSTWHDTITLYSYNEIISVTSSDTTNYEPEIRSKAKNNTTSVWTTDIRVHLLPAANTLSVGEQLPTTLTINFSGASAVAIPFKTVVTNRPELDMSASLNGNAVKRLWSDLVAGNTYDITAGVTDRDGLLDGKELRYHWTIDAGSEYATLSDEYTTDPTVKLTTIAKGSIDLSCDLEKKSDSNWKYVNGMCYEGLKIDGALLPIDNSAIDSALSGGEHKIDVGVGKGLNAASLSYLKSQAAADGVDKVTFTHDGNANITMSFNPSELDDSFTGTFTPAFSTSKPDFTDDKGISNSGEWVDFVFSGVLPAPMTITMVVDPDDFPADTTEYTVWYYNPDTGRMEDHSIPVVYDTEKHTITFTLEHFSAYLVLEKGTNPNPAGSNTKSHKGNGVLWLSLTATAGEGGSITNAGTRVFKAGEIKETFVITPDEGYCINTVQVDGKYLTSLPDGNKITLTAIYGPRAIVVTFRKK